MPTGPRTTQALPRDAKGRTMYRIPGLLNSYETARGRKARIAREAARAAKPAR